MTAPLVFTIRLAIIASLVGISFILTPGLTYACKCAQPGTPSQELESSTAVFAGRVVSVNTFTRADGTSTGLDPVTVEFEVSTIWKGPDYGTYYLTTPRGGESCGLGFNEGDEFLVYSSDGETANRCSRTRLISEAAADLEELGDGRSPTPGTAAPTPVIPDDLMSSTPTTETSSGGGCEVGSSVADLSIVGLMAGIVWFGVRKRRAGGYE